MGFTYCGDLTPVAPLGTERQDKRLQKDWREQSAEDVLLLVLAVALGPAICWLAARLCFRSFSCLDVLFSLIPLGGLMPLQPEVTRGYQRLARG